jgi:hypothetical protein
VAGAFGEHRLHPLITRCHLIYAGFLGIELGDAIVERVVGGRVTPAIPQDVAYISYLVETKVPAAPGKYCRLRTQRE